MTWRTSHVTVGDSIFGPSFLDFLSPPFASVPFTFTGLSLGFGVPTFAVTTTDGTVTFGGVQESISAEATIADNGHIHGQVLAQAESDGPANSADGIFSTSASG